MIVKNTIIYRIMLALIAIIIGIQIYMLNAIVILGNPLPMPFGYGFASVLSGSMEPALNIGDLVVIKESDSYYVGDIIVYQEEDKLVVHRIIEKQENKIITKGDANNVADEMINEEWIKGKVISRVPLIGHIIQFMKSWMGIIISLIIVIPIIMIPKYLRRKDDEAETQRLIDEIERLKND